MKRLARIFAFFALTYVAGGLIAKTYLEWPVEMPDWLRGATEFMLRITGEETVNNNDKADIMATFIVSSISWALTGLVLWLIVAGVRRVRNRKA